LQTYGDTSKTVNPHDPQQISCVKFGVDWCWLLIPPRSTISGALSLIKDDASTKVPFSYVTYFYETMKTQTTSGDALAFDIPLAASGGDVQSVPLDFAGGEGITSAARPFLVAGVWLVFLVAVVNLVTGKKEEKE